MSDMKCPFCQQELETWAKYTDGTSKVWCSKCNLFGDSKLFSELIRTRKDLSDKIGKLKIELEHTRKALEIAKDTIRHADWFLDGDYNVDAKTMHSEIKCAIKGITALEQKDK